MPWDKHYAFISAAAVAAAVCLSFSCGYTVRSGIAHDISSIHIAPFENRTFEHGLELELSQAITREFIAEGTLSVADISSAEARMSGAVVEYLLEPYTYGASEADVEQYRVLIKAEIALMLLPEGRVIWKGEKISGEAAYYVAGTLAKTESEAAREALRDLARRTVEKIVRPW